jgi:hypothetical protein
MFEPIYKTGIKSFLAAAVVAVGLGGTAGALPLTGSLPAGQPGETGLVTEAQGSIQFGFYFRGGHPYYSGYRGYPYSRPGWRRHRGYWFPPNAFYSGRSYNGPYYPYNRRYYRTALPPEHYDYCFRRYRSYRASDNTFQPYRGPRRPCRSPYWR